MRRRLPFYSLDLGLVCICLAVTNSTGAHAQETTAQHVMVSAEEEGEHDQFTELGEYAQPAWAERGRFSSTTSVYVLSPYEVFAGNLWTAYFPPARQTIS